jgi:hypothetical protein
MSDTTGKPESKDLAPREQADQPVPDPVAGTALGMEMLDGIAGGNGADADAIRRMEGERQKRISEAVQDYRHEHPYVHPDALAEYRKTIELSLGFEGKSGA